MNGSVSLQQDVQLRTVTDRSRHTDDYRKRSDGRAKVCEEGLMEKSGWISASHHQSSTFVHHPCGRAAPRQAGQTSTGSVHLFQQLNRLWKTFILAKMVH